MNNLTLATIEKMASEIADLKRQVNKLRLRETAAFTWTAWTPDVYTGWTALPTGTYLYMKLGYTVFFIINITDGTSNDVLARIGLPFAATGNEFGGVNALCMDNGTVLTVPTKWYIGTGSAAEYIQFQVDMGTGAFTASGTKRVRVMGFYRTAE